MDAAAECMLRRRIMLCLVRPLDHWKLPMSAGLHCEPYKNILRIGFVLVAAFATHGRGCGALGQQHAVKSGGVRTNANADLLNRAKKLVQSGDPQGAIALLDTADLDGPRSSDIHALKGVCLALLGRPVQSATEFDTAIALRPNYAPTYFSAGLAFASFNNVDRALDRLEAALKLDPKLPGARYNYALVLARAGRFAESDKQAEIELDDARGKTESLLDLWRLKARDAYYQKNWPETIAAYRKALELDPDWPEAYGAMGEALFSLNRTQESLPLLQRSEALDADNAVTHSLLGKLYQDQGKREMAIAELELAQRLRPNDQEVLYRLYRLYSHGNDAANAGRTQKLLKDLIASRYDESLNEMAAAPSNNAGVELEKQGDLAGALKQFDQAASEDATNLVFKRNAALILCRLGRTEEAVRRLRDILDLDPDDAQTLQILSVAKEYEVKRESQALPSLEAVP
jgi:tetratricopeptide (TPR) repeat protein